MPCPEQLCACQHNPGSATQTRCCFLVDLAIGLKPPVLFEFQSGTECSFLILFFFLISKWIVCFSYVLTGRCFYMLYICKDWLSYGLGLSCCRLTRVTTGLLYFFSWWLHKKNVIQDRTLAEHVTWFVRLRWSVWWSLSYLTWKRCQACPPTTAHDMYEKLGKNGCRSALLQTANVHKKDFFIMYLHK